MSHSAYARNADPWEPLTESLGTSNVRGCCKSKRMAIRSPIRAAFCMYMSREYESAGDEMEVSHLRFSRRVVEYRYLAMRCLPRGNADTSWVGVSRRTRDVFDRLIKVILHLLFFSFILLLAIYKTGYSNFD